ncbi:MAG TPA: nitronate monooxygenase [Myxococcales bacterium]|nr:nitronate monooxygenase [Myxococcales bacterium]HIK84256.1 nitronate monooxygenase [Myxococcales bacterium]
MRTLLCELLGIEFPIFAFTHCRDVVAAVSNAGGLGVLGAVGFSPEQLEVECKWIDDHVGDNTYGVDLVIPQQYEGIGEMDATKLEAQLRAAIPQQHREFAAKILADHDVPELPPEEAHHELLGMSLATATPQLDVALQHEKVRLIANALGTPPAEVIERVHESGRLVAALCGKVHQAVRHKDSGIDIIIAQGTEGGGHTGEIGSLVLWPQIIEAVDPVPVLAAGGIGSGKQIAAALAMGAQGVWTGSLWLTVEEAECPRPQMEAYLGAASGDTVRSRSFTGKPCRMLQNDWTNAWEAEGTPEPLGMPLQNMVAMDAIVRTQRYAAADRAQSVSFNPVGQVVGMMNEIRSTREVIFELAQGYFDAVEKLNAMSALSED